MTQAMPRADPARMGHIKLPNSATMAASRMPCSMLDTQTLRAMAMQGLHGSGVERSRLQSMEAGDDATASIGNSPCLLAWHCRAHAQSQIIPHAAVSQRHRCDQAGLGTAVSVGPALRLNSLKRCLNAVW